MLDSHCHLNDEALLPIADELIERAFRAGVTRLLVIGYDFESSKEAIAIAHRHEGVYAAIGFHPENLNGLTLDDLSKLEELAKDDKVIAIGEIGLDHHWQYTEEELKAQTAFFIAQIELANKLNLPISIHARDASLETYEILSAHPAKRGGVLHCYSGSPEMMERFGKLGYYFGFDGPITFKNAKTPKECVVACPLDRILSETDAPYLAPVPHRGERNEPAFIPDIVKCMAELKGISLAEMEKAIEENFDRLFLREQKMTKIDALIVVEGKSDIAFLSSFLEADFVTTNGSEISKETIEYIKRSIRQREVIVLTDPDSPGKRIRDRLDEEIPGLKHAFVPKEVSIKNGKVGVAESTKEAVLEGLAHLVPSIASPKGNLMAADLVDLDLLGGENSKEKRDAIAKKLHLGATNGKTFLKRCNALGITKNELEEALHG